MRFLLFLLLICLPLPALAQGSDYTVADIAVDQPTQSPSTARDEALEVALKKGYEILRQRRAEQGEKLPEADSAPLWKLMQDFEVTNERVSATRYIGTFTIRFRPNATTTAAVDAEAATLAALGPLGSQSVVFRFNNLMEWQSARAALSRTAGVRRTTILGLRRNQVDVQLEYTGAVDALAAGLGTQGFIVSALPNNNAVWLLGLRR